MGSGVWTRHAPFRFLFLCLLEQFLGFLLELFKLLSCGRSSGVCFQQLQVDLVELLHVSRTRRTGNIWNIHVGLGLGEGAHYR